MIKYDVLREKAIELRLAGKSINELCEIFALSKGTLWPWIKHIPLQRKSRSGSNASKLHTYVRGYVPPTVPSIFIDNDLKNQIFILRQDAKTIKQISLESKIEKRDVERILSKCSKLDFKTIRLDKWKNKADELFDLWKANPLFMLGLGLYWGEGSKKRSELSLCNSDPNLINCWLKWCKEFIGSKPLKFKLNIHSGNSKENAINFWKQSCQINDDIKCYVLKSRMPSNKPVLNRIPNGTIYVAVGKGSYECLTMMKRWLMKLSGD